MAILQARQTRRRGAVGITLAFLSVQNIHVMRRSMRKLTELCLSYDVDQSTWLTQFAATHWLEHASTVLSGALQIVRQASHRHVTATSLQCHC